MSLANQVDFSADGMTITLALDANTIDQEMDNYTIIVPAGAFKDRAAVPNTLDGFEFQFQTAPDIEPLLLLGVAPANTTTDVAIVGVTDLGTQDNWLNYSVCPQLLPQLLFACLNYCLPVSATVCLSQLLFALN